MYTCHCRRSIIGCGFERYRYFPGQRVLQTPPRLLLVSPALKFHPATETLLRFFAPEIDVERIGLAEANKTGTKASGVQSNTQVSVAFRLHGWREPWHSNDNGSGTDQRNTARPAATQPG
jgi:hypothetical protein